MTPTQTKLLKYLKRYKGDRSTAQISKYLGIEGKYSRQTVYAHLTALEDKGYLVIKRIEPSRRITLL